MVVITKVDTFFVLLSIDMENRYRHFDVVIMISTQSTTSTKHDAKIQNTHAEHCRESDNLFLNNPY